MFSIFVVSSFVSTMMDGMIRSFLLLGLLLVIIKNIFYGLFLNSSSLHAIWHIDTLEITRRYQIKIE